MTTPPAGLIFTAEQQYALDHLNGEWGTNDGTHGVVYLDTLRDRILGEGGWSDELRQRVPGYGSFRIDVRGRLMLGGEDVADSVSPDNRVGARRRERRPEYVAFCEAMLAAVAIPADDDDTTADADESDENDLTAKAIAIGGRTGRDGRVSLDIVDVLHLTHDHRGKALSGGAERSLRAARIYVDQNGVHLPACPSNTTAYYMWPRIVPQLMELLGLESDVI